MKNWVAQAAQGLSSKGGWGSTGQEAQPQPGPGTSQPAAAAAASSASGKQSDYVRLPLESARKLRWYDKADLAALVRTHLREKRELEDALAALKKVLLRSGLGEADLDGEVQALLDGAVLVSESDEGVATVLLAGAMAELEALRGEQAELQQQLEESQIRLAQYEAGGAPPSPFPSPGGMFTLGEEDTSGKTGKSLLTLSADLAEQLSSITAEYEASIERAAGAAARVRGVHGDVLAAEAAEALALAVSQGGVAGDDSVATALPTALVAKLQRLEAERRQAAEELVELGEQLETARTAAAGAGLLAEAASQVQAQADDLSNALAVARAELASAKAAARVAEESANARVAEARKQQGGGEAARALQDAWSEAQERAMEAGRRATVMEARCSKSEGQLKEKVKQLQQLQAEHQALAAQLETAQAAAAAVPVPGSEAPSHASHNRRPSANGADMAALSDQVKAAQESAVTAHRELMALKADTASRMHVAEAREARLMADLRECENLAAERDDLAVTVIALRGRLAEGRAEQGQFDHLKQVAAELGQGRSRLEEELLVTGQLATQLDARLREASERAQVAETAAQMAEARVHSIAQGVTREVEARLVAAAQHRSLWPVPAKEEVARLESRVGMLSTAAAAAQKEAVEERAAASMARARMVAAEARVEGVEGQAAAETARATEHTAALTAALQQAQHTMHMASSAVAAAERERDAAIRRAARATSAGFASGRQTSIAAPVLHDHLHKWQVQNSVGGGSLYGVGDHLHASLVTGGGMREEEDQGLEGSQHIPDRSSGPFSQGFSRAQSSSTTLSGHLSGVAQALPQATPDHSGHGTSAGGRSGLEPHLAQRVTGGEGDGGRSSPFSHLTVQSQGASRQQQAAGHPTAGQTSDTPTRAATPSLSTAASFAAPAQPAHSNGISQAQVDTLYLKNVVFKFLEAALAGRAAERDALLPAVATLLRATPAEFQVFRKVVSNTAPPGLQVLSALGKWMPG